MKVDFVIGGTQKGGTSALDRFLREHPQICLPADLKEVHFFDREELFRASKPDYENYHSHFRCEPGAKVIGEASPIYMYWNNAPQRIWSYNRAMKWIVILRNPVDRAYSAWNMERNRGADALSFEQAIDQEAERCREALPLQHRIYSYVDRGFYSSQLRRIFNIFGRERCLVLLNEELQQDHQGTLKKIFGFLGLMESAPANAGRVFEQEYEEPLAAAVRRKLVEVFYFDIRELERMLGRDLSQWYITEK